MPHQKLNELERLVGGVAHEFNNLLTVINTTAELISYEPDLPDGVRADIEQIRNAGRRAAELTRQLVAFGRRQALDPRPIEVNATIESLAPVLAMLIGEQVQLTMTLSETLPRVNADPAQLGQVVLSLVKNAVDAMPEGGQLRIGTRALSLDPSEAERYNLSAGSAVEIAVTDTGVGMDAYTLSHAFDPFFTTKELGRGPGLGLAAAHGIMKQMGGDIRAQSEPGRGTTFFIVLPAVPGLTLARPDEPQPDGAGEPKAATDGDDAGRSGKTRMLAWCGYVVSECDSSPEAPGVIAGGGSGIDEYSDLFVQKLIAPDQLGSAVRRLIDKPRRLMLV